jgi:alpha-D-xyloside xylohydrolase/trinucleotide repeat-containing gene 6 protein
MYSKLLILATSLVALNRAQAVFEYVIPPRIDLAKAPYAEWAHYHWVWLNGPVQNQQKMTDLVKGYKSRNISVGAINIDSAWSTGFNNFEVDTAKFPDLAQLVKDMHDQSIRVILWATSMVNTDSSNFADGDQKGYYIKNFLNFSTPISWWHGYGSLLDYSNPDARAWWHK